MSMGLGALTDVIAPERVVGIPVGEVTALAYDSRRVAPGTLFFAVPGVHVDGHDFVGHRRGFAPPRGLGNTNARA